MKDFLGNEIKLGDIIITNDVHYQSFVKGEVTKINDKTVSIKIEYAPFRTYTNRSTRRYPSQVVVIKNIK